MKLFLRYRRYDFDIKGTSARVHENAQKKALDDAVAKAAALQKANEKLADAIIYAVELKKAKSGSGAPKQQPKQRLSNGEQRNTKVIAERQILHYWLQPHH